MPAHRKEPTPEQLAELPRLTTVTAAHRFGVSAHTIVRWRRDYAIPSPLSKRILAEQPEPEDEVAPVLPAQTWTLPEGVALDSGLWRTLETLQQQMGSLDPAPIAGHDHSPGERESVNGARTPFLWQRLRLRPGALSCSKLPVSGY